ncbi:MAG TPA: OmpH family outer membrane protein [Chthoniobacterales bacterium]|jgi:outer membrane protein|nr:OmpH family outer membrane protein [Chthoniobacterales bacterium]
MKQILFFATVAIIAFSVPVLAQTGPKIGTVELDRIFKEYKKTKESEKKINEAKDAAKKEYDERVESYKKALDEINKLNQQLDSPALSADKKTSMAKDRDDKIANIKNMERELNEFRQTRERQLQEQMMRMRESIVKEITEVVMERVRASGYDMVFDKSGLSTNGVPVLLQAKDSFDFTAEVSAALNKGSATNPTPSASTPPKK